MADVFISYSHKDQDYVHRLAETLKQYQIDVWIDTRLDYGDQWPRVIEKNLAECRVFIVIMTPGASTSTWVQNEVSYAQNHQKPIFPLLLEGNLWLSTASLQYVDVRNGELPPEKFFERLKRQLNAPTAQLPQGQAVLPPVRPVERTPPPHKSRWGLYIATPFVLCIALSGFVFLAWLIWSTFFTSHPFTEPGSSASAEPPVLTAPVIETAITQPPNAAPLYDNGIITFITDAENSQALFILDQDGTSRPLLQEPGITALTVLCASPLTGDTSGARYLVVRYLKDGAYDAIVLNIQDASSVPIAQGVERVNAICLDDGEEGRVLVEVKNGDTAVYRIHEADGSNSTDIFTTLLSLPTSTPLPTATPPATP